MEAAVRIDFLHLVRSFLLHLHEIDRGEVITPPQNRGEVIFSLQFVFVSVCLFGSACEQNSSRTDELI